MHKNNLTALLTDLRALILNSRPAYRDFLGEVTEAKTMKILENAVLSKNQLMLPVADAAFSGFIAGRTYKVVLDGEEKSIIAKDSSNGAALTNIEDFANPPSDYWLIVYYVEQGVMVALTSGSFLGTTISVYYDETVTEQKWSVKKLAYELLPDRLLSALSAAANTARNAQSTANAAQSVLGNISTGGAQIEVSLTFDKQTSGRDSFVFNGFNYYKFSEFSPDPADVVSFSGTSADGVTFSEVQDGENCRKYGYFIAVEKAGACTLPITSTDSGSFTAQSAGLYASFTAGNDRVTAGTAKFTCTGNYLLVHSSTGKKFIVIADDSGNLSTVEATTT